MKWFRKLVTTITIVLLAAFCVIYAVIETLNQRQVLIAAKGGVSFRIDSSFSPERLKTIKTAIRKWEIASGECLKIPFKIDNISISDIANWAADGIPTIYNASNILNWKRYLASQLCLSACLGVALQFTGDVFVIEDGDELFETVVLHEIGHILLGGWHSNNSEHLMYPTVAGPKNISEFEATNLKMMYCNKK